MGLRRWSQFFVEYYRSLLRSLLSLWKGVLYLSYPRFYFYFYFHGFVPHPLPCDLLCPLEFLWRNYLAISPILASPCIHPLIVYRISIFLSPRQVFFPDHD